MRSFTGKSLKHFEIMIDNSGLEKLNNNGYRFISFINEEKGLMKVSHDKTDNAVFVAKKIRAISVDIYSRLQNYRFAGIPEIFDIIRADDYMIVIEQLIDGQNLGEMIEEDRNYLKHVDNIDHIIAELLNTLEELSSATPVIIHRDIKPDNIMIDNDKKVFLIDFSISRELDGDKVRDTIAMGTRGFAAPEQYGFSESDIRTDFYGLGATIKYILDNVDMDRSYLPDNERLKLIEDFTAKCMMMDKKDRFQNVREIRRFLGYKQPEDIKVGDKKTVRADKNRIRSRKSETGNKTNEIDKKYSYALPGFRTKKPEKMVLATFGYSLVFAFSILAGFVEVDGYNGLSESEIYFINILTSILTFLVLLIVIFFLFNYRGMKDSFPIVRDLADGKKKKIWTVILAILLFFVLFFCEGLFVVSLANTMK